MTDPQPVAVLSTTISRTVGQFYNEIIATFQDRGYAVHVITTDGPEVSGLRDRCDAVHLIPMVRGVAPIADCRALLRWLQLLRTLRPTVVFAGTPKAGLLAMVSSRLMRSPHRTYFLQGLRLEGTRGMTRKVLSIMEWLTSWCSQTVLAVSPSLAERYCALGLNAGRLVLVPHNGSSHGVDTSYFSPQVRNPEVLREVGLSPVLPVVTFVGRLTKDKGLDTLIAAVGFLRDEGTQVQLLVVGAHDEVDSALYVQRLRDSGVPVAVSGPLTDVRPLLSVTDILVLPTWREGMPNVVLEAAAMEIPVVTTNATGAVDSVIPGVTGYLTAINDHAALGSFVSRLIHYPVLRESMGRNGRKRVINDFQPDDVAAAVVSAALGSPESGSYSATPNWVGGHGV